MESQVKTVSITKNISVSVKENNRGSDLNQALYAINWFNTKVGWLYKFYNMLAVGSVLKVDGKPFFKGKTDRILMGDSKLHRQLLLIVRYPNANSFLKMISGKYFQMISLLRQGAVKDFTFGFATKRSKAKWKKKVEHLQYVLHHMQYDTLDLISIEKTLEESKTKARIFFIGEVNAHIHISNDDKLQQAPCIIDGLLLFETEDLKQLENFLLGAEYQKMVSNASHSSLTTVKRIF